MRIKRLYIGDFGIFRNQILENIDPGMVVIGGLNRAGKSTFMNILRYLGYGFPQSTKLPPANGGRYEIEADLMLDDETIYNLKILGFGEPSINKISGLDTDFTTASALYGIDQFTYHQLFTISLQQLDKIPREISGKDIERLQSILLGAGFAELIRLPVLESEMTREADKIGGKRGEPRVKQFKPYFSQIQEGIELKKKALQQVESYQIKKEELSNLRKTIEGKNEYIRELEELEVQLEAVRGNFGLYEAKTRLELDMDIHPGRDKADIFPVHLLERVKALKINYESIKQQCAQQAIRFKQAVESDLMPEEVKERLLKYSEHIVKWVTEISGIKEQIRQYSELDKECRNKKADLIVRMQGLNRNWGEENLKNILELPIDKIEEGRLLEYLEKYKSLKEERKRMQESIEQMENEEERLLQRLESKETTSPSILLKRYIFGAVALVLAGGIAAFLDWGFGLLLAIAGIIGAGLYTFIQISSKNSENIRRHEFEAQLETVRMQIDAAVARYKATAEDWRVLDSIISEYRTLLGLKSDVSSDVLRDYYSAVRDVREKYLELKNLQKQADELNTWLRHRLERLIVLLAELEGKTEGEVKPDQEFLVSNSEYIFMKLNKWYKCLSEALELQKKEEELGAVEQQIDSLIGIWETDDGKAITFEEKLEAFINAGEKVVEYLNLKSEFEVLNRQLIHSLNIGRIRDAILSYSMLASEEYCATSDGFAVTLDQSIAGEIENNDLILTEFEKLCQRYGTIDEVEKEWKQNKERLEAERNALENLKERYLRLQDELNNLATMENLEKAQKLIDDGRNGLRPLAYQYAVYKTAAFLIEKVRENLVDGVKDIVLGKAAQILETITNGDYVGILPPENWMEPDFKMVMREGTIQETADILSQGTREQLYLAVRISRILDIKPALPVILDDCMANFDCRHLKESLKIFAKLSKTHQIFMLTCHPELVEAVANCTPNAQYWFLDRGKFELSNSDELIRRLA